MILSLLTALLATTTQAHDFKCTGRYGSYKCTNTLYLNDCRNEIKLKWEPLKYPGTDALKKSKRTYCSVTWNAVESVEERKLSPKKCDQVLEMMATAFRSFPEVKWQDTPCTHLGTSEGVLYSSQEWPAPTKPATPQGPTAIERPRDHKDPEPKAIGLSDVRSCTLHNPVLKRERLGSNAQTPVHPDRIKKITKRTVRCPVLQEHVHAWLRKFLATLEVSLEIKNELQ